MKTLSKNFKNVIISLLCLSIFILSSILLVGCGGDNAERDVTKLDGIIEAVQTKTVDESGELTGFTLIFLSEPSEFSAIYNETTIEVEKNSIEDYENNGLIVTAYSYSLSFDAISEENYSLSPIQVNLTILEQEYEFELTTDLFERIYPSLAE